MTHPLAYIAAEALRQEFESEMYYDRSWRPSINVKNCAWFPRDLPWDDLRAEFDHADTVKAWIEALCDDSEYDQLDVAEEIARETWWDDAIEIAHDIFGAHVKVYGEGRQGGHLVVHGIGSPDEWADVTCEHVERDGICCDHDCDGYDVPDIERVRQWAEFRERIEWLKDDFGHLVGWHLIVNVHDHIHNLAGRGDATRQPSVEGAAMSTPIQRLALLLEEHQPGNAVDYHDLTDIGHICTIERNERTSEIWMALHARVQDAIDYHFGQEYASDWWLEDIVDLSTGAHFEPVHTYKLSEGT